MKHSPDEIRNALPREPESCHQALMQAARSVKEDEPVKKVTFRTVLIAALLMAAMTAVAVAASTGGLAGWFQANYRSTLPLSAQDILSATEHSSLTAGPVAYEISELLCDGQIAYMTAQVRPAAEGSALVYPGSADPCDPIGEEMARVLNRPDLTAQSSWLEAAKATGLPLYSAMVWLEPESGSEGMIECEMMDGTVMEDGTQMLVYMLYFRESYAGESLAANVCAMTSLVDPETVDASENWRSALPRSIPINGETARRTYQPQGEAVFLGQFTLTGATAVQTSAGVYVSVCAKAAQPITLEELNRQAGEWQLLDAQGNSLPIGISLTGEYLNAAGQPFPNEVEASSIELETFQFRRMVSLAELPERMIVTDGTVQMIVE